MSQEKQADNKDDDKGKPAASSNLSHALANQTNIDFGTFPQYVVDLFYWRDPFLTASVFAACLIVWFFVVVMNRTILSLLSYCAVFILALSLVYINLLYVYTEYFALTSIPDNFTMPTTSFDCMDEQSAAYVVNNLRLFVNSTYFYLSCITTCKSNKQSLTVLLFAVGGCFIGQYISGITLIALIVLSLFVVPYFHHHNRELIHSYTSPLFGIMYAVLIKIMNIVLKSKQSNAVKVRKKKE